MAYRPLPAEGEKLIKSFEGLVLRVYDDEHPKKVLKPGDTVTGVLTAGWGATGGLEIGQKITKEWAQKRFESDVLNKAIKPLYDRLGAEIIDCLSDPQWGALISFTFNLGPGPSKSKEWTIWKRVKAKAWEQVATEMGRFINWNGAPSQGLIRRRAAEVALWNSGLSAVEPTAPPSSVTRREETPATPTSPTPPQKSPTIISGAVAAVAAVPTATDQVLKVVAPYADKSEVVSKIIATVATIGAIAAILVVVFAWLKKRRERQ